MRFTFIFPIIGGLIGISSELLVSTVSVIADDVLRAPPMVVLTSSDRRQFDSQILSFLTSVIADLEGTILPIEFDLCFPLFQSFSLKSCLFYLRF